jgi:hypothetical protein
MLSKARKSASFKIQMNQLSVAFSIALLVQIISEAVFSTVKLGVKERLDKEQPGVKELFTDYQPFHTINLLLDKELLPSWEMLKLGEHEIMKTSKKGDFGNFLNPFCDFPPKRVPRIVTFSLHVAPI